MLLPLLGAVLATLPTGLPEDLSRLVRALEGHGFEVRFAPPPRRGVYGLYESGSRRLWVAPVTIPLGIARQTLIHEATHAVQSCPSGRLSPIGVTVSLNPVVEREISAILLKSYRHSGNRAVEREAFHLQGQPDAVPILLRAMEQRCR
ncbi:hypothetical protein EVJ50_02530 [Synechococcus sp. RSCCF101]|uniref:hypothetical protein n=1 Tax=Synechococcus sp. RSCCF101 TaxID=2511069 RepID=UPI001244D9A0|nr:hypothetical protein [Synechococcus sp. RSCCF101]QEY31288.1 hypothetical protein EVJ50_02530 [Synechococcus sp. RSCCF101]